MNDIVSGTFNERHNMLALLARSGQNGVDGVEILFGPFGDMEEASAAADALESKGYEVEAFVLNASHHIQTTLGIAWGGMSG